MPDGGDDSSDGELVARKTAVGNGFCCLLNIYDPSDEMT
ncbi:hypothetical protein MYAER_3603 [Microcystis aeruginosa NIES-2549]|uniref:Uncharacterized protein n=1 Tax=Microcystis aeruginosa NIES-2549 TaxID=1641812 RepID=A0A0F6U6A4_MICAE|nr:hypothetical protein MYAER_3603 [Microcystis aeruginosa NIES-2549]